MANPHRGEVAVTLDGHSFTLRPSWEALVEIEQATGVGIMQLAAAFATGRFRVTDLHAVLMAGLKAGGEKRADPAEVGRMIAATGIMNGGLLKSVTAFLENAITGGADKTGLAPTGEGQAASGG
jgi:hypothetical protein